MKKEQVWVLLTYQLWVLCNYMFNSWSNTIFMNEGHNKKWIGLRSMMAHGQSTLFRHSLKSRSNQEKAKLDPNSFLQVAKGGKYCTWKQWLQVDQSKVNINMSRMFRYRLYVCSTLYLKMNTTLRTSCFFIFPCCIFPVQIHSQLWAHKLNEYSCICECLYSGFHSC
jgi:hypothetical protein